VPILLKVAGSYAHFGVLQAVVGAVAWCILALTMSRLVEASWRSVVLGWAVLALATAPLVIQWDWSVLSESLSLSAEAMIFAAGIWLVRGFSWPRLAAMGLAVLAYVGIRDADIWDVAAVAVVLLIVGIHATIRGAALGPAGVAQIIRSRWNRTRRWLMVGLALLLASSLAQAGAYVSHRNVVNVEQALYIRVFPFPDRVTWFAGHGMPEAGAVDKLAAQTPPPPKDTAKVVGVDLSSSAWQPLQRWFDTRAESTYLLFLVTHPGYVLTAPFSSPPLTYNNALGNLSFYDPVHSYPLSVGELIFAPNCVIVIVMFFLAASLAFWRRVWGRHEWTFLLVLGAVGLISMLLSWHGDGEEVTRHMVEGDVATRLGIMLMFLYSIFAPSRQHAEVADPQTDSLAPKDLEDVVGEGDEIALPTEDRRIKQPVAP